MSDDKNLEQLEDDLIDELEEMKGSSMGDPSEISDPAEKSDKKNKSSISMKGSAKSAKLKGVEGGPETTKVTKPSTKMESKYSIITNLMAEMQNMDHDQLVALYNAVSDDEFENESAIDVQEEMKNLFGEDASEEFNEKASTIFEAAVQERVATLYEQYMIEVAANMEAERAEMMDELEEKVDTYLDYVVSEWVNDNELAIENGIKSEVVESFLGGMKDLFVEHYIDVPEDKVDVVEELAAKVEGLQEQVNDLLDANIHLTEAVASYEKADVVDDMISKLNLSATDAERLGVFAESIEASDADEFATKLGHICEHYFDESTNSEGTSGDRVVLDEDLDPFIEEEVDGDNNSQKVAPDMQRFVDAISANVKF